jgi:hypothetical protein
MKGLIKVIPESLFCIVDKCREFICGFDIEPYKQEEDVFHWLKLKTLKKVYYDLPFWHQYRDALKKHLHKLHKMYEHAKKFGDEIWLSELAYCHLIKLSNGDVDTNPIFIMDY